ncbi:mitochondrial succinate dehydrogenase cytochrome b560 subunit C [Phyllosticta capitalensis]|uniref:Mitochondrial succinate dehydrogenase cytochrome b560 subunit C n=1 Tax=Phyllosticta capitalensis TaxID=121624 RepID=A0ABR1YHX5_9PEZI
MLAQRAFHQALRRAAAPGAVANFTPASAALMQSRPVATSTMSEPEGRKILEKQRLNRPVSPHLQIYRPQITWVGSGLNRITGVALSGGLYLYVAAYVVAPLTGWHLESQSVAAAVAAWPVLAKLALKTTIAMPFTYHSFNGVRHLMWDVGMGFKNKQVIQTGWTCVALSVASAVGLACYGTF